MKTQHFTILLLVLLAFGACKKESEWLDIKPSRADLVPSILSDYEAMLDNDNTMNANYPYLPQVSADDFFVPYTTFQSALTLLRNGHVWAPDVFEGAASTDWNIPYVITEYANICLEGISKIKRDSANASEWDNVRGNALFFRSLAFYMLAQEFAAPYRPSAAATELGIPIRTGSDVNIVSVRATQAATYERITTDLLEAITLLPEVPLRKTSPSVPAAEALLARVYLIMQDYARAGTYAGKVLAGMSDLLDYNTLSASANYAFPNFATGNKEVLFYATAVSTDFTGTNGYVDTLLYRSYAANDLRRTLFFRANGPYTSFRGSYTGRATPFGGISLNEMYLVRAESNVRQGNTAAALADLNALLVKRWKTGTFTPITASSQADALSKILAERRKELIMVGSLRWEDLRRLNQEPAFAKSLIRVFNGQTFTLAPNDPKYALPIPDVEIRYSGIPQNPR
jgi:hypothetical protein